MKKCSKCKKLLTGDNFNMLSRRCKDCEDKIEAEANLKTRLVQAKIATYTATSSQLQPYLKKYGEALKEIWSLPKYKDGNAYQDYEILQKHGLGRLSQYFGITVGYQHWDWDYQLKELNKQLFQLKIG